MLADCRKHALVSNIATARQIVMDSNPRDGAHTDIESTGNILQRLASLIASFDAFLFARSQPAICLPAIFQSLRHAREARYGPDPSRERRRRGGWVPNTTPKIRELPACDSSGLAWRSRSPLHGPSNCRQSQHR